MSPGSQSGAGASASDARGAWRRAQAEFSEGHRLLATGDASAAAQRLRSAADAGVLPPTREADVRYLLARALGACGDRDGMIGEWGQVLRLDAATTSERPLMTAEEFESVAKDALDELPQALLDELQSVAILVADRPSPEMVAGGIDPRVLGIYHGVPMTRRSVSFGAPYADTIYLFRANLERVCPTREALAERIRVTVLHETAHYFGYSERQLREMGLA
jgi:predicted Zn-dependent protease with MMP-like domain